MNKILALREKRANLWNETKALRRRSRIFPERSGQM